MIEALIELVLEIVLQLIVEVLVECGLRPIADSVERRREANPFLAMIGLFLLGALVGLGFSLLVSERLLPRSPVPGISLTLAPIVVGTMMHLFGNWLRSRGRKPTLLATFWGGSVFAFAAALVRFLLLMQ
jgi:hypothetical protein